MAKYIVDIPDEILEFMNGKFNFFIEPEVKVGECKHYKVRLDDTEITPYTEPDVAKNNKVNLCDSCNYIYPECPSERYDVMFGDGAGKDNICCCAGYRAINEQEIRQKVEDEVWEFTGKIQKMTCEQMHEVLGITAPNYDYFCNEISYQEAKSKYESWKKQKDEIRVGDEVNIDGEVTVVTMINQYGEMLSVDCDGMTYYYHVESQLKRAKKTGRHFDEIEELLKKMRKESENK